MSERRDLLARPAQGLKWLRARLADLLTATIGDVIAALAGLVRALSPWLVFAALAAGIAALISTDARVWLTAQATRGWALVAGEQAGPPGFLYIEAPQVYTRERLVNDRFTQANWLRTQLERTREESIIDSFSKPSEISQEFHRLALELRAADRNGPRAGGRNNDSHETDRIGIDVQMDRLDLFKKVNAYRDTLRSELMDVQLDDGHDLDGNTLYRLNFNAVVAPFHDQTRYPGSAVFLIRAKKPTPDHKHDQLTEDNIELLHQWQREMQAFLTQVLEQRLESFEQNSALENPTDPKEDLALDWFMRTKLVETFLHYLNDFPQQIGPHLKDKCDKRKSEFEAEAEGEETTDAEKEARAPAIKALVQELLPEFVQELLPEFVQENIRNCRIDELSRLAGFAYRTDAPSPEMQPEQAAGFRRAIELAHLVNVAQWPKAGPGSYNARCANELKTEIEQDEAKAKENGSQRGNGDEQGEREDDPEQGNQEGGNLAEEPEGGDEADIQEEGTRTGAKPDAKAPEAPPGGAVSGAQQAFEIRVEQECLVPYEDPYRLRALSRLLSVTDDLGRRSRTMLAQGAESAAGTQNEDDIDGDPQNPFAKILRRFGEVLAKMEPGEGGRRTETMKKEDAQDAVAKILRRFGEVLAKMEQGEGGRRTETMKKEDAQDAVAKILRRFGEVLPKMEPGAGVTIADLEADVDLPKVVSVTANGDPRETFSVVDSETKVNLPKLTKANGDPSEDFSIAELEKQVDLLIRDSGQLTDLARRCETMPQGGEIVEAAIDYARCRFLFSPSFNVRGLLAEFIVARVNGDLGQFYEEKEPVLKDFLHVTTEGCLLTECRILVNLKTKDTKALASDLVTKLNDRTNGLSIYEISPRADKKVRHTGGGSDLSVWFAAPQGRASAETSKREEATDGETVVLGFGQPPAPVGTSPEDAEAVFGWTVRPQQRPDGSWSSSHHRFSAVISVPSWWKRLDLEIHACWIDPKAARANVEALFVTPPNICETVHGQDTKDRQENSTEDGQPAETQNEDTAEDVQAAEKKKEDTSENAQAADEKENAGRHVQAAEKRQDATAPWHFKRPVRVQLPRSIEEVTARFNFDLVKTPYFDYAWKRENENASNALMAGRPAHIALAGQRLWRGTVVTIDGQPADRITVLPDMKGVIAEFRCVRPTPSISSDKPDQSGTPDQAPATSSPAKLRVWTAEGRTNPVEVNVWPFAPENDNETPCYIQQARAAAMDGDE